MEPAEESEQDEANATLEAQGRRSFMEMWRMKAQEPSNESAKEHGSDAKDNASSDSQGPNWSAPFWLERE